MGQSVACPFCTNEFQISPKRHYEITTGFNVQMTRTMCGKNSVSPLDGNLIAKDGEVVNCKSCIKKKSEMDSFTKKVKSA